MFDPIQMLSVCDQHKETKINITQYKGALFTSFFSFSLRAELADIQAEEYEERFQSYCNRLLSFGGALMLDMRSQLRF